MLGSLLESCEAAQGDTVPARGWGLHAWSLNRSLSRPWGGQVRESFYEFSKQHKDTRLYHFD